MASSITTIKIQATETASSSAADQGKLLQHNVCRDPVCCFIPPHMQDKVLEYFKQKGDQAAIEKWSRRTTVSDLVRRARPSVAGDFNSASSSTEKQAAIFVYNANGETGDGVLMEKLDRDGERVKKYSETVLDFLKTIADRNSVDGNGMDLVNRIHYGGDFDNAFWDGEKMTYGDGDELKPHKHNIFNCFTTDGDITWHELGHGVVQFEADFRYLGQAGALNEHWADTLGQVVLQYSQSQSAESAEWLIGANTIKPIDDKKYALRSMAKPGTAYVDHPALGTDPQPAHMDDYVETLKDSGGVHINSGIPNHAFYLVAMSLGGHSWERAFPIWYAALCDLKGQRDCNFKRFALATLKAAEKLGKGTDSEEYKAVQDAWEAVGVLSNDASTSSSSSNASSSTGTADVDDDSSCAIL